MEEGSNKRLDWIVVYFCSQICTPRHTICSMVRGGNVIQDRRQARHHTAFLKRPRIARKGSGRSDNLHSLLHARKAVI